MSIVAKKLQQERDEFISLHELLESIVKHDHCTLQEAAQFLHTTLSELDQFDYIPWQGCSKLHSWTLCITNCERLLRDVVLHGKYTEVIAPSWADDDIPF